MDAGAVVLWPEVEDLYTLMQMRVESGRTAFEREKQGSPVDPELCEWPESYFAEHIWFDQWPSDLTVRVIALDPSKGSDAHRGDYSAYVLVGIDRAGVVYVEADMARRPTPQMVADGAALCRRFRPDAFGVEANQFQELLCNELAAEFVTARRDIHRALGDPQPRRQAGANSADRSVLVAPPPAIFVELPIDSAISQSIARFSSRRTRRRTRRLGNGVRLAEDVWHGRTTSDGLGIVYQW